MDPEIKTSKIYLCAISCQREHTSCHKDITLCIIHPSIWKSSFSPNPCSSCHSHIQWSVPPKITTNHPNEKRDGTEREIGKERARERERGKGEREKSDREGRETEGESEERGREREEKGGREREGETEREGEGEGRSEREVKEGKGEREERERGSERKSRRERRD
jgi:hypothetical protein